jgi:hypothetical protein
MSKKRKAVEAKDDGELLVTDADENQNTPPEWRPCEYVTDQGAIMIEIAPHVAVNKSLLHVLRR